MAEGEHIGAVARLLSETVVGAHQQVRGRDANNAQNAAREIELQYQIAVSGTAAGLPAFTQIELLFDYAFHYAPAQRESNLQEPHFTYGSKTKPAVGLHATVVEWLRDKRNGSVVGAIVAIGAVGEGEYTGIAHLSFQGYATLLEHDNDESLVEGAEEIEGEEEAE